MRSVYDSINQIIPSRMAIRVCESDFSFGLRWLFAQKPTENMTNDKKSTNPIGTDKSTAL